MNISIRLEEERDYKKVELLTREAFWDLYRPGCCEHLFVHKIRKVSAFIKELSYVACDGDNGENPDPFMALELFNGALDGINGKYYDDQVFKVDNKELEAFEREFPYKEKHITDTQLK